MTALLAVNDAGGLTAVCIIWAIVIGLIVGGIAYFIPPSKPYAGAIGIVVALLVILSCLL